MVIERLSCGEKAPIHPSAGLDPLKPELLFEQSIVPYEQLVNSAYDCLA